MTSDYSELEKKLAEDAFTKREFPSAEVMAAQITKHVQCKEFVRLGVHGAMRVVLSLFAPLLLQHKSSQSKKVKR